MNFFKYLMLLNAINVKLQTALEDNELTLKEIEDLIDTVMKQTLGYGLENIAISIKKKDGKTEIKLVIKEN